MASPTGILHVFRHRVFRTLWIASLVSNIGAMIQLVGASWMMTLLTPSQAMVALVQASVTMPLMLGSLPAGVLADNYHRRNVLLVAQVFMFVTSIILTWLAFADLLTPWSLLTFSFLIGCGMALHNPSWQASFGELVPKQDLPAAVSTNAMGMNVTRSVGPATGGFIVAIAGAPIAFAINAVTYVTIIAALIRWRPDPTPRLLPREGYFSGLAVGVRYFLLSPTLILTCLRGFAFGFGAIGMQALLPLVARDKLGADASVFGVLLGAFGAGAVLGALNSGRIRGGYTNETVFRGGHLFFAATCLVVAASQSTVLTAVMVFAAGAAWINVFPMLNATVQLASPRWVLGRTISIFMTFIFGGMTLGAWVWGAVAQAFTLETAFVAIAAVLILAALVGLRLPLPQHATADLDPANRFSEPSVKLDLHDRSGPIQIQVTFEIAPEDMPEFLQLMADRRRIHIRDGARHWVLVRDLEQPDTWIESYRFPTWTEYVRHNQRRTKADDAGTDRLFALNRSGDRPRVQRLIERQAAMPLHDAQPIMPNADQMH